ncbi:DUF3093 domain-containing protein [Amnibacterium kyonggiense]
MQRFRERLVPGVGPMLAALLLLPAVYIIFLPISPVIGAFACVLLTALVEVLLVVTAPIVAVHDGLLVAGAARIPVGLTGETEQFRGPDAVQARGPGLDARAYTMFRGWVDPVVRVTVEDPDDPAPYWLVSTRRPDELRAALAAERTTAAS